MIKTFIYNLLQNRHFWRDATFSEVAELYASRTLRVAAIHIGAGFTSVFLYKENFSLSFIMLFWALIYFGKAILTPLAGFIVARIGTAKGTLISNMLYIPAMLALGFMPELGLLAIIIFAICMGISGTLYEICYYVEFSIVKNPQHAGKEIGFMNILEKITITASPVLGGLIALVFGVQVTMWVAGALFALSAIPLFKTIKKSETKQRITIRGFPWKMATSSMLARTFIGFDIVATSIIWSLFVVIYIFPSSNDDIYVIIGALSSVTVVVAIIASIIYGKIIDKNRGGSLLKVGVGSNSIVHLSRIFASTPAGAVGVNIVNEAATTAQNMAFLRGIFDVSDVSGHRMMYLIGGDMMSSMGASLACIVIVACESYIGGIDAFRIFFMIAAVAILGVGIARFPIYRK